MMASVAGNGKCEMVFLVLYRLALFLGSSAVCATPMVCQQIMARQEAQYSEKSKQPGVIIEAKP